MSERRVYIGPNQLAAISSMMAMANMSPMIKYVSKQEEPVNLVNAESLIYSTLIQCGVDRFEIPKGYGIRYGWKERLSKSKYLDARITHFSPNELAETYNYVHKIFDAFLPKGFRGNKEFLEARELELFLVDLLIAAKRKVSCVTFFESPDMSKAERQVPSGLLFPIRNLINSFESVTPSLPCPKSIVTLQDVNRFDNLINSDLFSNYISQHERLENLSNLKKNAINDIVESGKNVLQSNLDLLQLKDTTISVLSLTTTLIEVLFGKLPGVLADYSVTLMTKLFNDERRIVMYQLSSVFEEMLHSSIIAFLKEALGGNLDFAFSKEQLDNLDNLGIEDLENYLRKVREQKK